MLAKAIYLGYYPLGGDLEIDGIKIMQKRVVKVNFCLFCAKNVLGLGVEFFALFQEGLLVVVVVDGIRPKLCFQAKTATLGVVGLAQVSAQKVSAVKLYAGHIGVAIQRDTCFD